MLRSAPARPVSSGATRMQTFARRVVMANTTEAKQALRKTVKQALKQMDQADAQQQSEAIASSVVASPLLQQHSRFGVYLHAERLQEVNTMAILDALLARGEEARCYVPLVVDNQANMKLLHLDSMTAVQAVPPFGIREPSEQYADGAPREDVLETSQPLDMLLMPGLAFDTRGGRLGRGGGYYDAFIARCAAHAQSHDRPSPLLVALAFKEQLVPDGVPMAEHDRRVDVLVTAEGVHRISRRGQQF